MKKIIVEIHYGGKDLSITDILDALRFYSSERVVYIVSEPPYTADLASTLTVNPDAKSEGCPSANLHINPPDH